MPFIGTQPEVGGYSVLDALTASATASYTLQKDSANFSPSSANQLLVSLNGVIQKPGSSFTVSGSTLTFSSALASSDSIDFIIAMGEPLLIGTPSDGTVTSSKLASNIGISTTGNIATTGSGTLAIAGHGSVGNAGTVAGTRALTVVGATDGTGSSILVGYNSSLASKFSVRDDGYVNVGNGLNLADGNLSVASGHGIDFSAGGNAAGMTSELLDDYEVGTWTPTVNGLSGAASGYSSQVGHYTKIGNIVVAYFRFTLTNKGNISGNYALIQGLPFNHSGSDGGSGMVNRFTNLNSAVSSLGIELGGSTPTAAWLTKVSSTSGTSDTYVTTGNIANNTFMQGSLIYRTG